MEGILGLLHLAISVWAIYNIFNSDATTGGKILWTAVVLVFPLIGLIIWWFAGPKMAEG